MSQNQGNSQENNQNQQVTDEEHQYLLKWYEEFCKSLSDTTLSMKLPSKNIFFFCKEHNNNKSWSSNTHGSCINFLQYTTIWKTDGGLLFPVKYELSYLINLKAQNSGKHVNSAEHTCAIMLFRHWTDCNVYPMTVAGISKKVTALFWQIQGYSKVPMWEEVIEIQGEIW